MAGMSREEMLERIRQAGVVGVGGGGFPAHVKFESPAEVAIANGAECEPLMRVDQQRMAQLPGEVLRGLQIVMEITGAKSGVIGIKEKYHAASEALGKQLALGRLSKKLRLHSLGDFYPAGDELILVREVLGRIVPEFGLPLSVGAVVSNVSTLIDVVAAVDRQEPVTHRFVTVAGEVARPATFRVPLGAPLSSLVEAGGGATVADAAWLIGGPMMGSLAKDPESPVTKTLGMLLVLPPNHPVVLRRRRDLSRQIHLTRSACLKCMMCTEVCPRNLLGHRLYPDRMMRNIAAGVVEDLASFVGAHLCSECGLCSVYGCVMSLDPAAMNREMKARLTAAGLKRPDPKTQPERVFGRIRAVPSLRLVARLGLSRYDRPAPFAAFEVPVRRLVFPLKQPAGVSAVCVVKVGQSVNAGDLLGEIPERALGARVHASAAGVVAVISDQAVAVDLQKPPNSGNRPRTRVAKNEEG